MVCPELCTNVMVRIVTSVILITAVVVFVVLKLLPPGDSDAGDFNAGGAVLSQTEGTGALTLVPLGDKVVFSSPNYPDDYDPYQHTEWHFKAPAGGLLTLLCEQVFLNWFAELYAVDGNTTVRWGWNPRQGRGWNPCQVGVEPPSGGARTLRPRDMTKNLKVKKNV
ncbi:uncharacterized protein LOC108668448 [Hyalella azteca]|uniref:Uncharacterized protein LOC108668448 n=1 Tax=Hyalella azteca TaxID=294128 RepID=A0A8B7NC95_HYAAZ|nr:uncharacterized protein LOC108668448 [Hyalella azteca]